MCGIQLLVWKDRSCEFCKNLFGQYDCNSNADARTDETNDIEDDLRFHHANLLRRGPDYHGSVSSITYPGYHRIQYSASVLQMRAELREQPVSFIPGWAKPSDRGCHDDDTNNQTESDEKDYNEQTAYLCWNGEIYQQVQSPSSKQSNDMGNDSKEAFMYDVADTTVVANHLSAPMKSSDDEITIDDGNTEYCDRYSPFPDASARQDHIASVMSRLYNAEFAFCVLTRHGVYFGRDLWGRRSLLLWTCPMNCGSFQIVSVAEKFPRKTLKTTTTTMQELDATLATTTPLEWTEVSPGMVHCILFSEPATKIPGVVYPEVAFPTSRFPEDLSIPPIPTTTPQSSLSTISDRLWRATLELEFCLRRAVTMRLDQTPHRRSTGVLFSGGVDSVVLAALAAEILSSQHRAERQAKLLTTNTSGSKANQSLSMRRITKSSMVPILHLYNVSFGPNPEKSADRKAALKSYQTLRDKYKNSDKFYGEQERKCNDGNDDTSDENYVVDECNCDIKIVFRDIIVGWENICLNESHIRTVISPKSTLMDVNIATALWFASRGRALENQTNGDDEYCDHDDRGDRSPRVLLLGMGADELMGGYGRHRKAYEKGGWEELKKELTMDQNRLWERNCGRDDRLCSDHGREARFPFLDAHVVHLLQETMAKEDRLVCDFSLPPGVGDKRILRLLAERLGLEHASGLVKRAIQFGSRISHLSDTKRFGSRRKAKGAIKI